MKTHKLNSNYSLELDGDSSYGNSFTIVVKDHDGNQVGFAGFFHAGSYLVPEEVDVDFEHRRKGLATAMYLKAQSLTQTRVMPSETQSEEAQLFWSQPNRPFGS